MPKPTIVDFVTIGTASIMQPLFDLAWDVFGSDTEDRPVNTVDEAREKLGAVAQAGDTMTGPLTLPASDPTLNNHAARKSYVDQHVRKDGDTMTGPLALLDADPTLDDHAARKAYVDTLVANAVDFPVVAGIPGYIRLPGGILIQWGIASTAAATGVAITFPQPFSGSGTYVAFGSYGGGTDIVATFNHISGSAMQGHLRQMTTGASIASTAGLRWCAVGY